jgi:hypothetical protein
VAQSPVALEDARDGHGLIDKGFESAAQGKVVMDHAGDHREDEEWMLESKRWHKLYLFRMDSMLSSSRPELCPR